MYLFYKLFNLKKILLKSLKSNQLPFLNIICKICDCLQNYANFLKIFIKMQRPIITISLLRPEIMVYGIRVMFLERLRPFFRNLIIEAP